MIKEWGSRYWGGEEGGSGGEERRSQEEMEGVCRNASEENKWVGMLAQDVTQVQGAEDRECWGLSNGVNIFFVSDVRTADWTLMSSKQVMCPSKEVMCLASVYCFAHMRC